MPLVLPVQLLCNTSDEQIYRNIRINSQRDKEWIHMMPVHDKVAVMCGSGPSLADTLPEIRKHYGNGDTIFAMNGAAKFLCDNLLLPDYQVIIDARPETAALIGPAKAHLFASQCAPELFEAMPTARLWHLQVGDIENYFPNYQRPYALIGGAAAVGNTALCLAYVLGFRNMRVYGFDSSHRDNKGHAFPQPMNDGDPVTMVEFMGKKYMCSLTMKLQAEKFQETSRALMDAGCDIQVFGSGLLPDIFNNKMEEREKYVEMWSLPEYRECSPGEMCAKHFMETLEPAKGSKVLDIGCGTGRGGLALAREGMDVTLMDFAENCMDEDAMGLKFIDHDITEPFPATASEYGFCADVMEHIPAEQVDEVLYNISEAVNTCYFHISTVQDSCGTLIGQRLHMTVKPAQWWREKLAQYFTDIVLVELPDHIIVTCNSIT